MSGSETKLSVQERQLLETKTTDLKTGRTNGRASTPPPPIARKMVKQARPAAIPVVSRAPRSRSRSRSRSQSKRSNSYSRSYSGSEYSSESCSPPPPSKRVQGRGPRRSSPKPRRQNTRQQNSNQSNAQQSVSSPPHLEELAQLFMQRMWLNMNGNEPVLNWLPDITNIPGMSSPVSTSNQDSFRTGRASSFPPSNSHNSNESASTMIPSIETCISSQAFDQVTKMVSAGFAHTLGKTCYSALQSLPQWFNEASMAESGNHNSVGGQPRRFEFVEESDQPHGQEQDQPYNPPPSRHYSQSEPEQLDERREDKHRDNNRKRNK
ncbi:MAG: hypothetical protein Sylvanvirus9_26 [Sylvanvirus sp.]|uniref:Uncharacterized protein n=1 Tax=Sylvanvirus sp. TaxID=2487774 RepID=A0A3G5AI05_9VIRU|nr:MAG: hypothetical protein Sylvanvirus9_26 [Sylvanvirus sp.]